LLPISRPKRRPPGARAAFIARISITAMAKP
jgi:hypothetical protein